MNQAIRLTLARVFEHCPSHAMLTGIFSAVSDGDLKYDFAIAGEVKLKRRLEIPPNVFLPTMLSIMAKKFTDNHGVKPAFVIEWIIGPEAIEQGVVAIAEEIERQVIEESKRYLESPEDLLDFDYELRVLRPE